MSPPEGGGPGDRRAADRAAGRAKMEEVYGFSVDPDQVPGDFVSLTVDHLFGEIWTRPGLSIRDRRLVTIGVLAALGQGPLVEIQFQSALARGELDEAQIREMVVHVAHYVGWPLSTSVNEAAERVIARHQRDERPATPRGTVAAGRPDERTGDERS